MTRELGVVLAVCVLAFAGCGSGGPADGTEVGAPPIRLLERVATAEATWPAWIGTWPSFRRGPDINALAADRRVVRVLMRADLPHTRDYRTAIVAPAGSAYRFALELSTGAVLRTGLGYVPPEDDGSTGAVLRFEVAVITESGERITVWSRTVVTDKGGHFTDVEVELGEWAGGEVTLELAVSGPEGVWGGWAAPEITSPGRARGWDILLVSLDTLRADHLSSYGYRRQTSPQLDAFAALGTRFEHAISQSPWTRPSHRSLLTGLHPYARGGRKRRALPRVLWQAGYRTAGITGGGQLDREFGFADGFEQYRTQDWIGRTGVVDDWLAANPYRQHFLFLHTYEIHDPYTHGTFAVGLPRGRVGEAFAREDWKRLDKRLTDEEKAYVEALYDGGIAYTDRRVGQLLDSLRAAGRLARTIVVITSDHGEQFWEHGGWRHGQNMYDHQLRVPLLLYLPPDLRAELGIELDHLGQVISQQVRLIDVYPTLLELVSVSPPSELQGRSLVPLLQGETLSDVEAFAESTNTDCCEQKALRANGFKFIRNKPKTPKREAPTYSELYDLGADPGEQRNLAASRPELADFFLERVTDIITGGDPAELDAELPDGIDPQLRDQLMALGYVGE